MGFNPEYCQICVSEPCTTTWEPFENLLVFVPYNPTGRRRMELAICDNCRLTILNMVRQEDKVFDDCKTLQDILRTVREELKT